MRYFALAAAALVTVETSAVACSCIATEDPAELQRFAAEAAKNALALVEVEALTSFEQTRTGERMRVVRTLAGRAPAEFQIQRGPMPSSASCDILYSPGQRDLVILYPPSEAVAGPVYRVSGLCSDHLLDQPAFRNSLVRHIGATPANGERG